MRLQITITPDERQPDTWVVSSSVNQDGVSYASTGPNYPCHSWIEVTNAVGYLLKSGQKTLVELVEAK